MTHKPPFYFIFLGFYFFFGVQLFHLKGEMLSRISASLQEEEMI